MPALLLALWAAMTQPQPALEREIASGIAFVRPQAWSRRVLDNQSVVLAPPGPDADRCSVMILPGQDTALDPDGAHDQAFRSLTQGSRVEGTVRRSTLAGWNRSEAKLVTGKGQPIWTALYTATVAKRIEAVMFVGATEAVFEAHRPSVERLIAGVTWPSARSVPSAANGPSPVAAPAAARGGAAVHGLLIPYPATWTRMNDPSGKVTLVPPQLQGVQPSYLSVLPPSRQAGTPWESHRLVLRALLGQVQWAEEPVTRHYVDAPGPFIRTSIAGKVATGGIQTFELYTAAHDGTIETVVGVNGIDRNIVEPVLRGVTFVEPPRPAEPPRIVEAYRRLDQKIHLDIEGGSPVAGSLMYQRIWLREDGVADLSTSYPEGYAASATALKVDAGLLDGDYGRWVATGNEVRIVRRLGSAPEVYRRENGGLVAAGQRWEPMPRVDDLQLGGRWSIRSGPGSATAFYDWIEFRPDGTFATEGVLRHVASGDVGRPKPPEKASGTYRIRDWTIFFTFADGSTWSTDFSTLGRDGVGTGSLLFRTTAYPRER